MTDEGQKSSKQYAWLPHMAVRACMRLYERHTEQFKHAQHFMIDVAVFLSIASYPKRGTRRTQQDLLDGLTLVSELKVLGEVAEERLLREARRRGITFQEIADAMGLNSRQAAEQRYLRLVGGRGEAEQVHMNRRRGKRFGYLVDAQKWHEDHIMNLGIAFRALALDSHLPEEIVQDDEQNS